MKYITWWLPILLFILLAPFTPFLDLEIERFFYNMNSDPSHRFISNNFTHFMYEFGTIPAWIVVSIASIMLLLSYTKRKWKSCYNPSLVLLLTVAIGAGFITHALLKDQWGRPRPKQVIEFGGIQEFRPFWKPNFFDQPEPSKSFPCGHCTMGFFFFALALVGKRIQNNALFWTGIILAFSLGIALSLARMMMGGHFLSDTIMSALIMWLTAISCDWFFYGNEET
jgi:lipid A 4'-phosphatase